MTWTAGVSAAAGSTGATYRLRRPPEPAPSPAPSADQQRVIDNTDRRLRVLAGPGTGKTATIVEAVAERIERRGTDPGQILVLTFSRRGAAELTDRLIRRLAVTTAEPLVRTLHSYAYAVLTAEAARSGAPAPRMLGAAESDRVVADLLAGHLQAGGRQWPDHLRPALASAAFASELRDLVLRTGERALSPAGIVGLGRRHHRPEWTAAGRFAREYQQVVDLRMGTTGLGAALDQAELTLSALELLNSDEILALEQARIRRVFVDEYQDVDPAQAALVERLASGADELVVVGDPDQAIYAFRGSDPGALRWIDTEHTVTLSVSRRSGPSLLAATRRVAALLPGTAAHRGIVAADDLPAGAVEIRVLPTAAREAAYIADRLRRARLRDGRPWSQMAVLVRSPAAALPALRRAFSVAGIPIATAADERGRTADPLVAALISVLECGLDPDLLDGARAEDLLTAPLGGAGSLDVLALRRLRRAVRLAAAGDNDDDKTAGAGDAEIEGDDEAAGARDAEIAGDDDAAGDDEAAGAGDAEIAGDDDAAGDDEAAGAGRPGGAPMSTADSVAALLAGLAWPDRSEAAGRRPVRLPDQIDRTVARLAGLLRTARESAGQADGESALWRLWSATGLQAELTAAIERGGRAGRRADETLDAVLAAFDQAAELAVRIPGAGLQALIDQLHGEQLPGDPGHRAPIRTDAVSVLSAHAAKGLQWDLVAVAAVQEGSWPDLRSSGGLLGTEDLLDANAGIDPLASRTPAVLADERRLFYVACTRARQDLLVTAVSADERAPSRFLDELAGTGSDDAVEIATGWPRAGPDGGERRSLHLAALVGELRRAACSPTGDPDVAAKAAGQLARLAVAGVTGAHPAQWYGLAGLSTDAPAIAAGDPVAVSPSAVEALQQCGLRGVLERRGARGPIGDPQMIGMMVHAAAAGLSNGLPEPAVVAEIDQFLAAQEQLPSWQQRRVRRAVTSMTAAVVHWLAAGEADDRHTIGAEIAVDLALPAAAPTGTDPPGTGPAGARAAEADAAGAAQAESDAAGTAPAGSAPAPANPVRMTGRIDHLSSRPDGRVLVTDFKTGSSPVSVADARQNLQLAAYQVAVQLGGVPGVDAAPGGAQLLYLRTGTVKVREQPPLEPDLAAATGIAIREAAGQLAGAGVSAQENPRCERCPVRSCCPLQSEGRQVTR